MNKEDYVQLHTLLAKMKFELEVDMLENSDLEFIVETKKQIKAIEEVANIFIVECE